MTHPSRSEIGDRAVTAGCPDQEGEFVLEVRLADVNYFQAFGGDGDERPEIDLAIPQRSLGTARMPDPFEPDALAFRGFADEIDGEPRGRAIGGLFLKGGNILPADPV